MRNILLIIKNNLYRLSKEKIIIFMLIIVLPIVIYFGIYFSQTDSITGKIAIVKANNKQEERVKKSVKGKEKVTLKFLSKEPTKTDLIKGIYLAEIKFKKSKPDVISYGKEDVKKGIEAAIKGKTYVDNKDNITVQGKIIGFLTMFLFFGSIMIMDFFLTDRENSVYSRVLIAKISYYEYIIGQMVYCLCVLTVPSIIMSLVIIKILSIQLRISTGLFLLLIFLVGLLSSSFSILICTLCKNKASASMMGSIVTMITCLLGGCIINIVDSNKIIGAIRECLPQKRLIDLANKYNNGDLIFLIVIILLFVSISIFVGKRQYENGDFA
ncbi:MULTISPECIES: ABC transporter permease [Clostridium]|uniref:ABC transporter permease n=1 Tax=Clostridium TaxID=1485 RepID=UPI000824FE7D|nr:MULTISPECIES: ABC transporter permease [Clostridium]PJI09454.1 hypothetical protein CUB90_16995 [Clostridium sp. CT7]